MVARARRGRKTQLAQTLARDLAAGKAIEVFGFSSTLDPYGLVTRGGGIDDYGCFVFDEAPMVTKLNSSLSVDEKKALFLVDQSTSINARYHIARWPKGIPMVFTCQSFTNAVDICEAG